MDTLGRIRQLAAKEFSLDTGKLETALSTRLADVKKLFTNVTGNAASQGLAQRIDALLTPQVQTGGILASRIATEQTTIDGLKKSQADVEARVTLKETQLRAMFTAMETAISKSQSLMSQLSGQLAQLAQ